MGEFTLPDFDYKTTAECKYLDDNSFKRIYLHHSHNGGRHMFGLFFPTTKKGHIYVVDLGRNDALPSIRRVWREVHDVAAQQDSSSSTQPRDMEFETRIFAQPMNAGRPIHTLLTAYLEVLLPYLNV